MAVQVAEWKVREVEKLGELVEEYPVVGIVDMSHIPAKTLQKLRGELRDKAVIRMSRKRMMSFALDEASKSKPEIEKLKHHISGQPALIFSSLNSSKLFRLLKQNRAPAPAKPGLEASKHIVVPKGNLGVPPGPLLGELQSLGVKTAIEGGKISVKKDKVVVGEGETISEETANILNKIGLEPLEVGLDLLASYEEGTVFTPEALDVSLEELLDNIALAYRQATNLSVNSGYLTPETSHIAIAKAYSDTVALAIHAGIFEPGIMDRLVAKALAEMLALAQRLSDEALDEELAKRVKRTREPEAEEKAPAERRKGEGEEEEKPGGEEAASGLGSLFD